MSLLGLLRRLARCTSGQSTLEAAIVLLIAIPLVVGGIEFGNLFLTYGTAAKSMRDAVRYLAHVPNKDADGNLTGTYICSWGLRDAKNLAIYGSVIPPVPPEPLIRGWTNPETTVTLQSPSCGTLTGTVNIILEASVPYTPLVFSGIPFTSIQFFPRTLTVRHEEPSIGE